MRLSPLKPPTAEELREREDDGPIESRT
jgi:hypothetical protein